MSLKAAIMKAVDCCIQKGILEELLKEKSSGGAAYAVDGIR